MRRLLLAGAVLGLAACTSSTSGTPVSSGVSSPASQSPPSTSVAPSSSSAASSAPSSAGSSSHPASSSPALSPADAAFARMSLRERIGQLLMVDCPTSGLTDSTQQAVEQYHVGSVILDGTSFAGSSEIGALTSQLQRLAPGRMRLLIATDQEGGLVQRLQGPGFTRIPAATVQGQWAPATLRAQARQWGSELRRAGVTVDLAPVLDTVPAGFGANPPIGDLHRQYGSTPAAVTAHGIAVARGLLAARVAPTVKHFPGLGRVHGNTDVTAGVTDTVTTADDPYLDPFRAAVRAHLPFVMMSTAIYARLDPGTPAAFSSRIVTDLLRGKFGFRGLVISDDLGGAAQVAGLSPGQRAVRFVDAGGDVALTVDAGQAPAMTDALLSSAKSSPAFRAKVDAAVRRVLAEKQRLGLLG